MSLAQAVRRPNILSYLNVVGAASKFTKNGAVNAVKSLVIELKTVLLALSILLKHTCNPTSIRDNFSAIRDLMQSVRPLVLLACSLAPTVNQALDLYAKITAVMAPPPSGFLVRVDQRDVLYDEVLELAAVLCSPDGARQLTATMNGHNRYVLNSEGELEKSPPQQAFEGRSLVYRPALDNTQEFTYKGRAFGLETFGHVFDNRGAVTDEAHLLIRCLGANNLPIKDLLADCKTRYNRETENRTTIWVANGESWGRGVTKPCRNMNSVSLDTAVKEQLIGEVERFLSNKERCWYNQAGLPYRRGMLFWGPPGTGKTSCSISLAGHFGLNIFFINLSDAELDGNGLRALFDRLPAKCIVLLEDIDSAGICREGKSKKKGGDMSGMLEAGNTIEGTVNEKADCTSNESFKTKITLSGTSNELSKSKITLSDLLNVIDGVSAAEGRILIMTSNEPDDLDSALIRPGRCDSKFFFGLASHDVIRQMFRNIFCAMPDPELDNMARDLANKMPEHELSPAEVSGFLLARRDEPLRTLLEAEDFVRVTKETKKTGLKAQSDAKKAEAEQKSDEEGDGNTDQERGANEEGDSADEGVGHIADHDKDSGSNCDSMDSGSADDVSAGSSDTEDTAISDDDKATEPEVIASPLSRTKRWFFPG